MQCPYNKDNNCEAMNNKCDLIKNCSFKTIYSDCGFWNKDGDYIPDWQKIEENELQPFNA